MKTKTKSTPEKASPARLSVRRIAGFTRAIGIGRTTFYALPPALQPKTVTLGTVVVITETPDEYLARIAAVQAREGAGA